MTPQERIDRALRECDPKYEQRLRRMIAPHDRTRPEDTMKTWQETSLLHLLEIAGQAFADLEASKATD